MMSVCYILSHVIRKYVFAIAVIEEDVLSGTGKSIIVEGGSGLGFTGLGFGV